MLRTPPSTSTIPLVRTGLKRPGMDMVERMAVVICPLPQYLARALTMSPATHMKGMGSVAKEMLS